jgi:uncharacterized protein (DUF1330 family)
MKAYVIALETVHDQAMFAEYAKGVAATLAPFEAAANSPCLRASGSTLAP